MSTSSAQYDYGYDYIRRATQNVQVPTLTLTSSSLSSSPSKAAMTIEKQLYQQHTSTTRSWLYNMYYVHFPFIMLTGVERMLLHAMVLLFMTFIFYGVYSYLPTSIMVALSRGYYYILGVDVGVEDIGQKLAA